MPPPSQNVRLVDIADRLGITKVSVSKALRDHSDISSETRELVKKTAAEMGYTPNHVARSLTSQRSHTLGVVVPKIAHTFFSSAIEGVQNEATDRGYGIILTVSSERAALESQHIQRLLAMRVDGLLVSASQEAPDRAMYERVRTMGLPLVFFDRQIDGLGTGSVTIDDRAAARRAAEHALSKGYRRLAHIAGTDSVAIGRLRREGYEDALRAHGIEPEADLIVAGGFDERFGHRAMCELLTRGVEFDAVFTVTQPVGLGARAALSEADRDDVYLVSFGDDRLSAYAPVVDAYLRQPAEAMGRQAVSMLLDQIEGARPALGQEPHDVLAVDLVEANRRRLA